MRTPREVNELHQLEDEAFVDTKEAAAFLSLSNKSLEWYRKQRPERSPKFFKVGGTAVRYRMGDLRAFRNGDPNAHHLPPNVKEG